MTKKEQLIDLLKREIEKIEKLDIVEDSVTYQVEVEKIETTKDSDLVRNFKVGKGRRITFTWKEAQ